MFKRFGFFILPVLLVFGALTALWLFTRPPAVKTAPVVTGTAVEAVYATAVVEPVSWAAVAPVRTGRLAEINVKEGDIVRKGDILARLDDADLRAQLREEEAKAANFASEFKRAEGLIKSGAIAKESYDQRKTNLTQSQARIATLEEQIRQLALIAPLDGTVLWRDVESGEVKSAGAEIFWVGPPRPLRLNAEIDEEDIPKIISGQRVLITADAFPGEALEGKIDRVSPKGDTVNKSYRAYMSLPDDTKLMIGMTVETNTIIKTKENALLVPVEAVDDGPALWIAAKENGGYKARKIAVKTDIRDEEHAEITAGVKDGDRVILPPWSTLSDGDAVRLK